MKRVMLVWSVAVFIFLVPKANSFGDVINFDYLQQTDALVHDWGPEVDVDGYRFDSFVPPQFNGADRFGTLGTLNPKFPGVNRPLQWPEQCRNDPFACGRNGLRLAFN